MSKQRKGNKEAKKPKTVKPKTVSDETPKNPKSHDGSVSGLFGQSK